MVQVAGTFPCIVSTLLAAIEMKCAVCTNVLLIYGTLESIAPWLCECKEKSAAQSSLSETASIDAQQTMTLTGSPQAQLANWRNYPNNE